MGGRDGAQRGEGVTAGSVLTGTLLTLLILFTLSGNALVCAAVLRFRQLRTKVTNVFIVSLALSDLLVGVLVMPWKAAAEVVAYWPFGGRFCDVWVASDIMCSTASILHLCAISVDRYWAISSPFLYQRRMTGGAALAVIAVAWALSLLISVLPVQFHWHSSPAQRPAAPSRSCDSSLNRTYAISSSLVSFYIPVAIMLVTYTRIFRIAQLQIRRIASLERAAERARNCCRERRQAPPPVRHPSALKSSFRKETQVLKTLSVIMGVFVCCWTPFFILNCMVPFCDPSTAPGLPCVSETTFDIFAWLGWANSALNPVVYAFNAEFRKAFSGLLGCRNFCSNNQVETVNISNQLVSYKQDTAFHEEMVTAYVTVIPNAMDCLEHDPVFDRVSQTVATNDVLTDSVSEEEGDADLSLDKITPFTSSGLH